MPTALPAVFLGAAALSALLAIASEERAAGRHRAFFVLKPLTTLLVLGAAATATEADPAYRAWICAALVLSMCGDIALMFPGNGAFVAGLGSFLVAHGLFVWAFLINGGHATPPIWSAIPIAAAAAFFFWLLPRTGPLRLPVMVYAAALVGMTLTAAARGEVRGDVSGALAAAGALLFLFSDSALAVRQFNGPYPRAQALILSTYWLAIAGVATSVVGSIRLA
jgi:uncharacterized membrane protein YhhN